jgi:hypothetical protein
LAVVGLVLCLLAAPYAQLAVPGPSGVVMGHLHLATKDVEASRRFWAALGGVAVQNGPLQLIQLPGTFVMLRQSQQTARGSEGSTVDRVVLRVRASEMPQLAKKLAQTTGSKSAALLTSPEGVTIELRGAASQEAAVRMERLEFRTVAPAETRDRYAKTFGAGSESLPTGATPEIFIAQLPGLSMYFRKADGDEGIEWILTAQCGLGASPPQGYTIGMKTAVSIPDQVFEQAERLARRTRKSRSHVFSSALREYVARHSPDDVTEAMDRVCDQLGEQSDPFVARAARQTLEHSEW